MKYQSAIETPYGRVGIIMNGDRISRLILPRLEEPDLQAAIQFMDGNQRIEWRALHPAIIKKISSYFTGIAVHPDLQVDYTDATDFDIRVWETAKNIPYGTTVSYTKLAEMIGKPNACRAVGNALGRNPVPIIVPCHRILRSDGTLGGFSAGLPWKRVLLDIETNANKATGG